MCIETHVAAEVRAASIAVVDVAAGRMPNGAKEVVARTLAVKLTATCTELAVTVAAGGQILVSDGRDRIPVP